MVCTNGHNHGNAPGSATVDATALLHTALDRRITARCGNRSDEPLH